jgi:hypothetical protein
MLVDISQAGGTENVTDVAELLGVKYDDQGQLLEAGGRRPGVTSTARHRVPPRDRPFSSGGLAQTKAASSGDSVVTPPFQNTCAFESDKNMPDWMRLAGQLGSSKHSSSMIESMIDAPAWASVVRDSCAATDHALPAPSFAFQPREDDFSGAPHDEVR